MLIKATLLLLLTANNNNTTASTGLLEAVHTATRPDGRHSLESQTFQSKWSHLLDGVADHFKIWYTKQNLLLLASLLFIAWSVFLCVYIVQLTFMFTLKQKSKIVIVHLVFRLPFWLIKTLTMVITIIYYLEVNDSVQLVGSKEKTAVHIVAFIMNDGSLCWTKDGITFQHAP